MALQLALQGAHRPGAAAACCALELGAILLGLLHRLACRATHTHHPLAAIMPWTTLLYRHLDLCLPGGLCAVRPVDYLGLWPEALAFLPFL